MTLRLLLYYLLALNLLTFAIYGIDKWKATRRQWRAPEATLLLLALLGGSPAALLAVRTFHHKTLHKKFRYGLPLIFLVQLAVAALLLFKTTG